MNKSRNAVLVVNAGSSSVKYQLIDMALRRRLAGGAVERIGEGGSGILKHRKGSGAEPPYERSAGFADHAAALEAVLGAFRDAGPHLDEVSLRAVGHRVVHGGTRFTRPTLVDDDVVAAIRGLSPLAPLHNPANATGIEAARRALPDVPHVAVFDTAFHQTMPEEACTYAVPREWRERYGVRRYGFHGTSYRYVARRAALLLGRDLSDLNLIVLHLGNGASACAIRGGRSVDTSMGLTPLEGLVMGTRSGDVDPALPAYLQRVAGLDPATVDAALNHDSGLLALAGGNDLRDVWAAVDRGDTGARAAVDVYCHRIRKYIGAYLAVLGGADAVVFTAGVGEHDPRVRQLATQGLDRLGISVDPRRNSAERGGERFVSPHGSPVAVLVVPTDEELEIAGQAVGVVESASRASV